MRSKKHMNHVTHPMSSVDISIFSLEMSSFCYIKKYRYRLHFNTKFLILLFYFFFWVLKSWFKKHSCNFDDVSKIDSSSIKIFWKKDYDVIIFFHDPTNKIASRDSSESICIIDVVMWHIEFLREKLQEQFNKFNRFN